MNQPTPATSMRVRNEARCRHILDTARPLQLDDLPWDITHGTLDDDVIDVLVYMRDVEGFTERDMVGLAGHTTTLHDPLIARLLERVAGRRSRSRCGP